MKSIIFRVFGIGVLTIVMAAANGKQPERISRDDCHTVFLVPNGLKYVEVNSAQISGDTECYIAFKYTGNLKISRSNAPSTAEDWRWLTDFALAVRSTSLAENLAQIKSTEGLEQPGMFKLVSREHFGVPGGEVYVLHYTAVKPTKSMLRLNQTEETIFAAGNDSRSVSYVQYTGADTNKEDKQKAALYRSLFSSFRFITD
jgi:hypothetical protein